MAVIFWYLGKSDLSSVHAYSGVQEMAIFNWSPCDGVHRTPGLSRFCSLRGRLQTYLDKYEGEGYGCDWIVAECSLEDEVEEGPEHRVLGHGLDAGLAKTRKKKNILGAFFLWFNFATKNEPFLIIQVCFRRTSSVQ